MAPEARMSSMAFSMSPPALVKAFLQSIMPSPVRSRSSLTNAAVISAISKSSWIGFQPFHPIERAINSSRTTLVSCRTLQIEQWAPTNGFRGGKKGAKPPFCLLSQRQGVNYSAAATGASSTKTSVPPATLLRPRMTASAIEPMYSWIARIASSLPGMM
ncbi:hypothetical protein D9M71_711210 [compost metagenome]